jgi:hypothetical protein
MHIIVRRERSKRAWEMGLGSLGHMQVGRVMIELGELIDTVAHSRMKLD